MSTRLLFILITLFMVTACQQQSPPKYSAEELAEQEKAWATMMEGHDRAMPLMTPISQYTAQVENIAKSHQPEANPVHVKATYHIERLETASEEMMDWMAGISDNPLDSLRSRYADHAAVMAAIDKETSEIKTVEVLMNNTLEEAKAFVAAMENSTGPLPQ